jgi:hypothetical protein
MSSWADLIAMQRAFWPDIDTTVRCRNARRAGVRATEGQTLGLDEKRLCDAQWLTLLLRAKRNSAAHSRHA